MCLLNLKGYISLYIFQFPQPNMVCSMYPAAVSDMESQERSISDVIKHDTATVTTKSRSTPRTSCEAQLHTKMNLDQNCNQTKVTNKEQKGSSNPKPDKQAGAPLENLTYDHHTPSKDLCDSLHRSSLSRSSKQGTERRYSIDELSRDPVKYVCAV